MGNGKTTAKQFVARTPDYKCSVHGDIYMMAITFTINPGEGKPPENQGPYCLECMRVLAIDQLTPCEVKSAAGKR